MTHNVGPHIDYGPRTLYARAAGESLNVFQVPRASAGQRPGACELCVP